jgi:cyclic pyranopterin phosphate synthase
VTTNGVLLAERAAGLRAAGLHRVTVSLDTLRRDRFRELSRRFDLDRVLEGLREAGRAGFRRVKINTVVMRGINDDEMGDLIELGGEVGAEVRFIEYMDVGGATRWSMDQVMTRPEILGRLGERYGVIETLGEPGGSPAERFRLPDGRTFGIISSTSAPFCGSCNRSRVTADGIWFLCLYAGAGIDLREAVRSGLTVPQLARRLAAAWARREDRGAEERLIQAGRAVLLPRDALREDPHLEMHTRGG